MKSISIIIALLTLSMAFVMGRERVEKADEPWEKNKLRPAVEYTTDGTRHLHLYGDIKTAEELFQKAIRSDNSYSPAHYSLGMLLVDREPKVAIEHSKMAYRSDTTNSWYAAGYAQVLLSTEQYEEAIPIHEKLIELDPLNLNAYRILALLYQQKSQIDKAISILDSAEVVAGKNPHLVTLKRRLLLSVNQSDRALKEAREMVEEQPYSPESRVSLATLYVELKADSLAEVEFTKAMQLDSLNLETLIHWSNFLEQRGRDSEYISTLRRVMQSEDIELSHKISLITEIRSNKDLYKREYLKVGDLIRTLILRYPNNQQLIKMQTDHLISFGLIEEASNWLKSKLDIEPPTLENYHTLINIESYLKRPDSVQLYIKKAIEKFPDERELRYQMAIEHSRQNRFEEAIECYRGELKGATDSLSSSIYGMIGDLYHQIALRDGGENQSVAKKNMKQCYNAYNKALKYNPKNIMVLNNYSYFLSENGGDLNRALEMSALSNELEKGNPTFLDTHAWILFRMGKYAESKVIMRQAIAFDTTQNSEIALHYGEILSMLGEDTMANFYWDQALKWGMTKEAVEKSRRDAETRKESEKYSTKKKRK